MISSPQGSETRATGVRCFSPCQRSTEGLVAQSTKQQGITGSSSAAVNPDDPQRLDLLSQGAVAFRSPNEITLPDPQTGLIPAEGREMPRQSHAHIGPGRFSIPVMAGYEAPRVPRPEGQVRGDERGLPLTAAFGR